MTETPLADTDRFEAANYDLETMVFEATTSKSLIVILSTLMGGLIAVIFVLLRSAPIGPKKSVAKLGSKIDDFFGLYHNRCHAFGYGSRVCSKATGHPLAIG